MKRLRIGSSRGPLMAFLLTVHLSCSAFAQSPAVAPRAELLREFAGSDNTDALLRHPLVRLQLQQLLRGDLAHLERNLNVKGPVDVIGGWLSISGNAPHGGTEQEAVVCVSTHNTEVVAAIYSSGIVTAFSRDGSYSNLPLCIKDWVTQANSRHKDRSQQPPNVRMAVGK
jgi:hypothetical protein